MSVKTRRWRWLFLVGILTTNRNVFVQGSTSKVSEAIQICRERLNIEPHHLKVKHSLAQLLDGELSTLYDNPGRISQHDRDRMLEVIGLYHAVGEPSLETKKNMIPPPKVRYESLIRAGTIAKDFLFDIEQGISYFLKAVVIDGIDDSFLIAIFEHAMSLLLSKRVSVDQLTGVRTEPSEDDLHKCIANEQHLDNYLQTALYLCEFVYSKCPNEAIVNEYMGATLRKLQQPQLAYKSYTLAMTKAKLEYRCHNADKDPSHCIPKLINFIRTSILSAAAGIEAGSDSDHCLSHLIEADDVLSEVKTSIGTQEKQLNEQVTDLYNQMGIIEKKRENYHLAYKYFCRALRTNPNDGHALVHLASIENNVKDGDFSILLDVNSLDANYVSGLFDGYSSRFESELVEKLDYHGHIFVYEAMQSILKDLKRPSSLVKQIVELGCGTGLLGDIIANEMPTTNLLGVDISQRMVQISKAKRSTQGKTVYSNVVHGDAVQYLSTLDEKSCDAILASDVFIYIGDLSEVLKESSKRLVDTGIVAFTVENLDDKAHDYGLKLLKSGRFGHSRKYIEMVASQNGFKLQFWNDCVLRKQGGIDVKGATVVLTRA